MSRTGHRTGRGRLVVVCASSGTGKTTICKRLLQNHPDWRFSISATTRPRRDHERDGADYHFLSDDEFDARLAADDLAEWEWVHGHRYGTFRSTLDEVLSGGRTLLLDIDVKGGLNIKRQYPGETVAVFIDPPDLTTLMERLRHRATEDRAAIEQRLARIPEEQARKQEFDHLVVNDEVDRAVREIESILEE